MFIFEILFSSPLTKKDSEIKKSSTFDKLQKLTLTNDTDESEELEKVIKAAVQNIIKIVLSNVTTGPDPILLEKAANVIWNISSDISDLVNVEEDDDDLIKLTVKELQDKTDEYMKKHNETKRDVWKVYLDKMFKDIPNVTLDYEGDFLYAYGREIDYLNDLISLLYKTPDVYLELYTWWIAVQAMILNTTPEMSEYISKVTAVKASTDSMYRFRALTCSEITVKFMGIAVSYGLAERNFLNKTKPKVSRK